MKSLHAELKSNHPLANYTSWYIGGPAKLFYQPADINDLIIFLQTLPREEKNIIWLGAGSNVLIRDTGIDGVVIHTKKLNYFTELSDSIIYTEAGVLCAKLAKYYPFLAGIPGTIGGALTMNAGAFGEQIWNYVSEVKTIDRNGNIKTRTANNFEIGYRRVCSHSNEWFVASKFFLKKDNIANNDKIIRSLLEKRAVTQPIGELTCGSVFRNPPNDYAARLIENCGLKGKRIGDAEVSKKHANFIVNKGKATSADVESLINYIKTEVKERMGVELILEVRILG